MIRNLPVLVTGLLAIQPPVAAETQIYILKSIEDGDTLVMEMDGRAERIQLKGIDAPEDKDNPKLKRDAQRTGLDSATLIELGDSATRFMGALVVPGDNLVLEGNKDVRDRYGRISMVIKTMTGQILNAEMVSQGYAVVTTRYPLEESLKTRLKEAEEKAIEGRRGLWGSHTETVKAWSGK